MDDENIEWWDYADSQEFAEAMAGDIAFLIERALDERGDAVVALPGSEEAQPVLDLLATKKLRWKDVTILPTDDLVVEVADPRSHARALASRFLPQRARVVPLGSGNLDAVASGQAADARLQDIHWPLDLVWLQLGEDDACAALYPGKGLKEALDSPQRAIGVPTPPAPDVARVGLTGPAILAAQSILLGFQGADRKAALEAAIAQGAKSKMPAAQLVARAGQAIDIHWFP